LWQSIQSEYQIEDAGGVALLEHACGAHDRAVSCAALIAEQGAVVATKQGPKEHPLLRHELAARSLVGRLLGKLGLDVEPVRAMGRPGLDLGSGLKKYFPEEG
jgi:hypothetical protein